MKGLESKLLPFKRIIGMRKTVPRRAANMHLTKVTYRLYRPLALFWTH